MVELPVRCHLRDELPRAGRTVSAKKAFGPGVKGTVIPCNGRLQTLAPLYHLPR